MSAIQPSTGLTITEQASPLGPHLSSFGRMYYANGREKDATRGKVDLRNLA